MEKCSYVGTVSISTSSFEVDDLIKRRIDILKILWQKGSIILLLVSLKI